MIRFLVAPLPVLDDGEEWAVMWRPETGDFTFFRLDS